MKVFFIYLAAFCQTGGIEKFNRAFMKAGQDLWGEKFIAHSFYDVNCDEKYISFENFSGFNYKRLSFIIKSLSRAIKSETIVVGHIKLAAIGLIAKILNPKLRVFLIVHGIDVWGELSFLQMHFIKKYCYCIMSVSEYTKSILLKKVKIDSDKIQIFPNTIDPSFNFPSSFRKPNYLKSRYMLNDDDIIIFTLCRLSKTEGFKGYDKVLNILPSLLKELPNVKYLLSGKSDNKEQARIESIINNLNLNNKVILTGFINESELIDHHLLADVFIMPSKKEGFGIVFIEAMACGTPTIAGNKDGSVDALKGGELGVLINPDNNDEILKAIVENVEKINDTTINQSLLQKKVIESFGFEEYKKRLFNLIKA